MRLGRFVTRKMMRATWSSAERMEAREGPSLSEAR